VGCNKTWEASMQADRDRLKELKAATARLENEAEQYRTAAESALDQLDWCVDYFNRSRQIRIAKSLRANCGQIRRRYL
jgi:hypothetical protein